MNATLPARAWTPDSGMARIEVLDAPSCARVLAQLDALRESWTQRHPELPFFTLGAASYIDAAASREAYLDLAARTNPILRRHFGDVLERVRAALEGTLGEPVEAHPTAALPGFHIYLAHKAFEQPIASVHCDSQYGLIDWEALGEPSFREAASFTLALALPKQGGGLNVWDLKRGDIAFLGPAAFAAKVERAPRHYEAYEVGSMVLHSGNVVHQAAPGRDIGPDERRITLQGHCQRVGGRWYLYW